MVNGWQHLFIQSYHGRHIQTSGALAKIDEWWNLVSQGVSIWPIYCILWVDITVDTPQGTGQFTPCSTDRWWTVKAEKKTRNCRKVAFGYNISEPDHVYMMFFCWQTTTESFPWQKLKEFMARHLHGHSTTFSTDLAWCSRKQHPNVYALQMQDTCNALLCKYRVFECWIFWGIIWTQDNIFIHRLFICVLWKTRWRITYIISILYLIPTLRWNSTYLLNLFFDLTKAFDPVYLLYPLYLRSLLELLYLQCLPVVVLHMCTEKNM